MNKVVSIKTYIISCVICLVLGYLIAQSIELFDFSKLLSLSMAFMKKVSSGVKWTDVLASVSAFATFVVALIAYKKWLDQKIQNDSYAYAKNYLEKTLEIKEIIRSINYHYKSVCPTPGLIPKEKDQYEKIIGHIEQLGSQLYQATIHLINAKHELGFWAASLTDDFEKKHDNLIHNIDQIQTIMLGFNSQLHIRLVREEQNQEALDNEKMLFSKYFQKINDVLVSRKTVKFKDMFTISQSS